MSSTISDSQQDQLSATEAASIDLCCSLCDLDDEQLLDAIEQMSVAPRSNESNSTSRDLAGRREAD